MPRKVLMATKCILEADGVCVYLDEYDTREEAEKALNEALLECVDYDIVEKEECVSRWI